MEFKRVKVANKLEVNKQAVEDLLKRRFFYAPAFSIYGGVSGLYDYGPTGCAMKNNLLSFWRRFFVLEENMLELETTNLTPELVLMTSGHVDKFKDLMVRDTVSGTCYRADHLLEEKLEQLINNSKDQKQKDEYKYVKDHADSYSVEELGLMLRKYDVKAPDTGNPISDPFPFNLMFETQIGPSGQNRGYLRPETAQGIFVNFGRLLEYNGGKLPFAAATIGYAFRNEISPRAGLLRVREFTLAEVEHFVAPHNKQHHKFDLVKDVELLLWPRDAQDSLLDPILVSVNHAVSHQIIDNQTLAYYIARVHLFLTLLGFIHFRFRQHQKDEMAHYATDCWDAEILTSHGWVECVGIADRSCYDLTVHQKKTGARLHAYEAYKEAREVDQMVVKCQRVMFGKQYQKAAQPIMKHIEQMDHDQASQLYVYLQHNDHFEVVLDSLGSFSVPKHFVDFELRKQKVSGFNFVPCVIEPSFGIGRILYSLMEQTFRTREEDTKRTYLSLEPIIAPVKCSVLPLTQHSSLQPLVRDITLLLTQHNISHKVDDVGQSIGRRYARTDEIGIPFGITIDFESVTDQCVTVRERDSMKQVRVPIGSIVGLIGSCLNGVSWIVASKDFPSFISKDDKDD